MVVQSPPIGDYKSVTLVHDYNLVCFTSLATVMHLYYIYYTHLIQVTTVAHPETLEAGGGQKT